MKLWSKKEKERAVQTSNVMFLKPLMARLLFTAQVHNIRRPAQTLK